MSRRRRLSPGIQRLENPTRYRVRLYFEGKQHSIGTFDTVRDAEAALAISKSEKARGIFVPPALRRQEIQDDIKQRKIEAVTVRAWADDWLDRLTDAGRSIGTTRSYRSTLDVHILPVIGSKRIIDVSRSDIDDLVDAVRHRGGPVPNVVRTLRALFHAAISAGVGGISASPVHVELSENKHKTTIDDEQIATRLEVEALAAAMPENLRIAVYLGAYLACRVGEVLGFQRRDFKKLAEPEHAVAQVRRQWHSKSNPPAYAPPKSGSARDLHIPALLIPHLLDHMAKYTGKDPQTPLLPSAQNPTKPISQSAFDKSWRAARDQVKPGFRFHWLRHTGLTLYAQGGATVEELMRRGGHRDRDAAARYQHATKQRDRALTDAMNQTLESEGRA